MSLSARESLQVFKYQITLKKSLTIQKLRNHETIQLFSLRNGNPKDNI